MDRKLRKDFLEVIILGFLREKGPMHGYGFIEHARRRYGFSPSPSMIYPVLKSLVRKGYVRVEEGDVGQKRIYVYSITELGERFLRENRVLVEKARAHEKRLMLARRVGLVHLLKTLKALFDSLDTMDEDMLERVGEIIRRLDGELKRLVR